MLFRSVNGFVGKVKHAYTHFKITLHAYACAPKNIETIQLNHAENAAWVSLEELQEYAFPKANKKIIDTLNEAPSFLISN